MSLDECGALGEAICRRLIEEIHALGFAGESLPALPVFGAASFTRPKDPYSGLEGLRGVWRNGQGRRLGEITFHADGSFYAEYDVLLPHPGDARWFVESVLAWGRDGAIKAEPRLLPALG